MKNNLNPAMQREHDKATHAGQNAVTWVLLCDGGKSKLFASEGDGKTLSEIRDHEQGDGVGKNYKSHDPEATPVDKREGSFIAGIAARINAKERAFARLVVAAPPNALHELRNELSKQVQAKIIGELHKDLMHENASTLPHHIKQFFDVKDSTDYKQK